MKDRRAGVGTRSKFLTRDATQVKG